MDLNERITNLETELAGMRSREKKLEHDLEIYRQIFKHLSSQMEEMKKELQKR